MQDHVRRLVGLEGFEVRRVVEVGGCCPDCGRSSVEVKDRPVVRVRDLPIAGKAVWLR